MAVTLLALMTACARALDDLGTYTISGATASTITSAAWVDATAEAASTRHDGAWVYAANQTRAPRPEGLAPATGTLTIRPSWAPPPTSGTAYLTHLFPMTQETPSDDLSYRQIAVDALSLLADQATIDTAIVKDAVTYNLPTWLTPERLIRVTEPHPRGRSPIGSDWRGWRLVNEGGETQLRCDAPFSASTGRITIEVRRPLASYVGVSGVWGENPNGPSADTDQVALGSVSDAMPAMLYVAYRALVARAPGRPFQKAIELTEFWLGEARKSRLWDTTAETAARPTAETAA